MGPYRREIQQAFVAKVEVRGRHAVDELVDPDYRGQGRKQIYTRRHDEEGQDEPGRPGGAPQASRELPEGHPLKPPETPPAPQAERQGGKVCRGDRRLAQDSGQAECERYVPQQTEPQAAGEQDALHPPRRIETQPLQHEQAAAGGGREQPQDDDEIVQAIHYRNKSSSRSQASGT